MPTIATRHATNVHPAAKAVVNAVKAAGNVVIDATKTAIVKTLQLRMLTR